MYWIILISINYYFHKLSFLQNYVNRTSLNSLITESVLCLDQSKCMLYCWNHNLMWQIRSKYIIIDRLGEGAGLINVGHNLKNSLSSNTLWIWSSRSIGNCEEELPKKPVGQLSVNCRPSVDRQVTDSLPTANQQVTDRLRKKENCGKHEQLTWCNIP